MEDLSRVGDCVLVEFRTDRQPGADISDGGGVRYGGSEKCRASAACDDLAYAGDEMLHTGQDAALVA